MKNFTRTLIPVELKLGFLKIPAGGVKLLPDETGKINVFLDNEKIELHYNAEYNRIFGLTKWYRENKVNAGDEINVEKISEKTFKLTIKESEPQTTEEKQIEEAKELIDLSRLTSTAKGDIVEDRIKELILLHGLGEMNVYKPVSDTEGIDLIVVKSGMFHPLFLQVKGRFTLTSNGSFLMDIRMKTFNPHNSYYVVGAYFNPEKLEVDDYILLIPTKILEKEATVVKARNEKRFRVTTKLSPDTRSKWKNYIIKKMELSEKLIEKFSEMDNWLR